MTMTFTEANREKSSIRIGIMGPTFSGKTYSALLMARGLVGEKGRIAVVDCEGGEANLYADVTPFDSMTLEPPYTPEKFIEAIEAAEAAGYNALILDTISHEWAGDGGILDNQLSIENKDPKRRWTCWDDLTPRHNRFLNTIIRSPMHIISTMRMKMKYTVDSVDGRSSPRKVGMGPIQRENLEYEFSILLEMDESHVATIVKDRSKVLGGVGDVFAPSVEIGNALRVWRESGVDILPKEKKPEPIVKPVQKTTYTESQIKSIQEDYKLAGWSQSIFDQAKMPDGLYDGDMIKEDWKKRKALSEKKPAETKPAAPAPVKEPVKAAKAPAKKPEPKPAADTEILCEECGAKITQTQKNMSIIFCNGKAYCDECRRKYKAGEDMKTREME